MSLLDDLRAIENFPPSHIPASSECLELLGKLLAHVEHGDKLGQAVDQDREARENAKPATNVDELLGTPPEDATEQEQPTPAERATASPAPTPPGAAGAGATSVLPQPEDPPPTTEDPRDARIRELEQQLANRQAAAQRTQPDKPDRSSWSGPEERPRTDAPAGEEGW